MYTKTQWVDNTTPIDKDNLNKIEQGIYDNSLVVDAVTNTLNPTDTETYKTAELTEGQITDVIGVSDIVIKGDTEQDGTPTPSAPVDINVVSGSNVINTGNENLFPLILDVEGTQILQQRCNVIIQKDEFIFTATGTDMYFGNVATANSAYQKLQGKLIKIPTNTQNIYLKVSNNAFSNNFICFFDENKVSLGYSNISTSKEVPNTAKYFTLRIGVSNSVSGTTYKTKVMASTMNKAYIPHQGKELPLDLPVENLFDGGFQQGTLRLNGAGDEATSNTRIRTGYVSVIPNTTYTISNNNSNIYQFGVGLYKSDNSYDSNHKIESGGWINFPYTFTTQSDTYYLRMVFKNSTDTSLSPTGDYEIMVENNVKANAYTPYGTDPIELCKIGDYQDYFYKSESKWYLHKEMTFEIRTSEDNWQTDIIPTANPRKYVRNNNHTYIVPANNDTIVTAVCNYPLVSATNTSVGTASGVAIHPNGSFYISADVYNNLNLSPIKMYIPLITPIDTEITDTTLISQLEAIYNAPLYEQTNITQTNNDLPMILDITACKDNINGIKAFIRK